MKQFLKNISPFNNRTDMPMALFVVKKFLAFWFYYIAGMFVAEGVIIILHFACGKNMLVGDVFDAQTIILITYYGYIIMAGIAILYWKLIEKKTLPEMGLTKSFGNYFIGAGIGILLLFVSVAVIVLTGSIEFHGVFKNADYFVILLFFGWLHHSGCNRRDSLPRCCVTRFEGKDSFMGCNSGEYSCIYHAPLLVTV